MTLRPVVLVFLVLLLLEGVITLALLARWWPQILASFRRLDRFQRIALTSGGTGAVLSYLFAFAAGAFFGADHMTLPRCFTVVALNGNQPLASTVECLDVKNDGLNVQLPSGVTTIVILDSKGRKRLQEFEVRNDALRNPGAFRQRTLERSSHQDESLRACSAPPPVDPLRIRDVRHDLGIRQGIASGGVNARRAAPSGSEASEGAACMEGREHDPTIFYRFKWTTVECTGVPYEHGP